MASGSACQWDRVLIVTALQGSYLITPGRNGVEEVFVESMEPVLLEADDRV